MIQQRKVMYKNNNLFLLLLIYWLTLLTVYKKYKIKLDMLYKIIKKNVFFSFTYHHHSASRVLPLFFNVSLVVTRTSV